MGTAAYISPDQMIGLFPVTPRSDIYSLGGSLLRSAYRETAAGWRANPGDRCIRSAACFRSVPGYQSPLDPCAQTGDGERSGSPVRHRDRVGRALLYALREGDRVAEARTEADGIGPVRPGSGSRWNPGKTLGRFPTQKLGASRCQNSGLRAKRRQKRTRPPAPGLNSMSALSRTVSTSCYRQAGGGVCAASPRLLPRQQTQRI